jgi:hypothetical protein
MGPKTGSRMPGADASASAHVKAQSDAIALISIVVRLTAPTIVARQTAITAPGQAAPANLRTE